MLSERFEMTKYSLGSY